MRTLTTLTICLLVSACGELPEAFEDSAQGVATTAEFGDVEVDVGMGIKRPMRVRFGYRCLREEWKVHPKTGQETSRCAKGQWQLDDAVWVSAKIYKNEAGRTDDQVFPAQPSCGTVCLASVTDTLEKKPWQEVKRCVSEEYRCTEQVYRGCGVAAAANVLSFYGVETTTLDIASHINSFGVPFSNNIATTPDSLASGLERLLNARADGQFKVTRKSNTAVHAEVGDAVRKGQPIILLVNRGGHYVMVTGFEQGDVWSVTDYVGSERKVQERDLGISDITGDALGWAGGYLPYTVIRIERRPR